VYGNAFIAGNHKYVTDFLTELHKRKYMFEISSDVKEIEATGNEIYCIE